MSVKDILNELKWYPAKDLENAEIWYIHRGVKNDTKIILGSDILNLGNSFYGNRKFIHS